jgi:hypothetical protein
MLHVLLLLILLFLLPVSENKAGWGTDLARVRN